MKRKHSPRLRAKFGPILTLLLVVPACNDDDNDHASATQASDSNASTSSDAGTADTAAGTGSSDSAANACLDELPLDTTDGKTESIMQTWGAPCSADAECVALLGSGAKCLDKAVAFELPGGYCSKPCTLPDATSRVVEDDPTCAAEGGVACVGLQGFLEVCAVLCTDDQQCDRHGYYCRQMPLIAEAQDPSLCLMPDCCENTCDDG